MNVFFPINLGEFFPRLFPLVNYGGECAIVVLNAAEISRFEVTGKGIVLTPLYSQYSSNNTVRYCQSFLLRVLKQDFPQQEIASLLKKEFEGLEVESSYRYGTQYLIMWGGQQPGNRHS